MVNLPARMQEIEKGIFQRFIFGPPKKRHYIFVLGCQRSGTSLMMDILDRDRRSLVYREASTAFHKQCLRPFSVIKRDSERRRASIYAYKPLLDSHRLSEFLSEFSESIVIWMYRDYRAVAVSSENHFAPGIAIRDLTPVAANSTKNWRNKGVSDESRDFVSRFFSKKMKALDAGAIFWLIRNRLLTESGHFRDNRVFLCKYEDLVFRSDIVLRALYNRIHCAYPGKRVTKQIHSYAINRGSEAALSAQVAEVCQEMLEKLDKAYSNQFSTNYLTCDSKSNAL